MANNTSKKGLGLTQGNKNTHIFTEFEQMNKEATQLQVLEAIKNIEVNVGDIIIGDITVESSDTGTHTRLDTLTTTVTNKHLSSTTDSVTVSGTVAISNDIIVVDTVEGSLTDAPYDLLLNGATLWADSTPLVNPFFADPNGREGWYYDNFSNIANKSNIYWYANPVSGNLQENEMTFAQLSGMYCIITPDYVENGGLTNPIMNVYSQPTGTDDYIPTFAHSMWAYSLTNTIIAKLRKSETIMLYTGTTRPQVHLNIPAYPLDLASTNGDALSSEIVAYMTVNTQATTSKIGYLLQYTGFLNSAIGFNREFQFKNGKERVIQNNQYSGSVSVSNFPATQPVSGSVSVSNFPATQPVSGSVSVSNTSLAVTGDFYPATQPVSGSISVSNLPATQPVSGSVSVSNFPATQPVSGSVSVSNTSLAVTGDFYPATQPVSGSISVSNLPATQPVSGSVSVSNFPATQPVSGSVSVSNTSLAVTGAFYQATQPVSGSISVSNLPATQPVSGSVSVSNFPATQPVSGSVSVSNTSLAVTGDFYPATQPVSGSISVSNLPATQPVSGSVSVSNFPATQPVSGSVSVSNTSLAVTGDFYPATQPVSGSVSISGTPSVNASCTGNFYQETQPISGSVSITGTPSVNASCTGNFYQETQPISGSVSITGTPSVNASCTGNFYQETQPISGSVSITGTPSVTTTIDNATSSIQIFGVEGTNNTKTAIKTDSSGKLEVVGEFSSVIDAATSSILMVGDDYSGDDPAVQNPLFVDANGFITTEFIETQHQDINFGFDTMASNMTTDGAGAAWSKTNPISTTDDGWYLEGTGLSTLLWYNNGNYHNTVFPIQSNFTFADIDIWFMILKNYFPFNTTTQIMPEIYIYSKPTGSGDFIAGLCHSVWYYTCNSGQSINYGESIMIYTGQKARVKKINPELRRIPYTNTSGGGDRANTEVINHIEFRFNTANTFKILVQEGGVYVKNKGLLNYYFTTDNTTNADIATIAMKTATDTINTNVATINTTASAINTKLTGMTYATNRLQTVSTLVDAGGDVATISAPTVLSGSTTIRALDSQSYVNAYDVYNATYKNLTMTPSIPSNPSNLYSALDVYTRNPATVVDNTLFGAVNGSYSGINMYPVQPKVKQLVISGTTASVNGILGGQGSTQTISNVDWGITKPKTFYISMAAGGIARTFYYDYIDTNGNERTMGYTIPTPITNWYALPLQTGFTEQMVGINNVRVTATLTINDTYYISNTQSTANTVCSGSYGRNYNAVITIPNNAIGYVSNLMMSNATANFFNLWKYDNQSGARKNIFYYPTSFAINHAVAGCDGSLGGYLQPGEAVLGGIEAGSNMVLFGNVVIKYLS
jgi:hypothetical protein